jgi:excisionase family DNA binding protein
MKRTDEYTRWEDVPLTLSTPEAAKLLRVHRNTVMAMIDDGRLPAVKIGRNWRINKSDVMRLLGETNADDDEPDPGSWGEYQHIKDGTFGE